MRNLLWSVFFIMLVLSGCGWDGTPTRPNDFTKLTSLEIVAVSPTIAANTSTKLTVKGNFSGIFTRDITSQVTWSTADQTIASFANTAIPNAVTGHKPGNVDLTATVGNISNTFTLTVSNATVTALAITPATPSVPKGLTQQFAVTGTFSDPLTQAVTTQDVTLDATWASSATTVATVSDAAGSKGLAQSLEIGSTQISATFGGISDTTALTVTAPVLQSIAVSTTTPSLLSLTSGTFQASGVYSDGTSVDVTSQVSWSSANTSIATITAGTATALSEGTTAISATYGGITGSTNLTVTGGHLTKITTSPATLTLVKGTNSALTATGTFSNNTARDITGLVSWSVANTGIATVTSPSGNLVWLKASSATTGTTTVTASYNTLSSTTSLTVADPGLTSIAISSGTLDLTVGTTARLSVIATFNDGTTQDVTANCAWTTSDATIAAVDNTQDSATIGRVSGVAAGSATITATYGGLNITSLVTVKTRTVQSLTINAVFGTTVATGGQLQMRATATYTDGATQDVTENATWSIDTPSVAILTTSPYQTGLAVLPKLVMGVGTGTATLSATFGGKTQTTTITVQ